MATFIVLYGGFVDETGELNKDAAGRCDKAIAIANKHSNPVIIFGGGPFIPKMPELAERTVKYLLERDWSSDRILWNPRETHTVDETAADIETLAGFAARDISQVFVVTSWNHLPRVWLIWKLLGGGKAKFQASFTTTNILYILWSLAWEMGGYAVLAKRFFELRSRRALSAG